PRVQCGLEGLVRGLVCAWNRASRAVWGEQGGEACTHVRLGCARSERYGQVVEGAVHVQCAGDLAAGDPEDAVSLVVRQEVTRLHDIYVLRAHCNTADADRGETSFEYCVNGVAGAQLACNSEAFADHGLTSTAGDARGRPAAGTE